MATVLSISGSPSATSRTARLARHLDAKLTAAGHQVVPLDVRTLPAEPLLGADFAHPAIVEATAQLAAADGVIVATPSTRPPTPACSRRSSTSSRSTG